jgi:hypothetical protein
VTTVARSFIAVSLFAMAALATGCPGEIADPSAFLDPPADAGCDAPGTVFTPVCGVCHHAQPGELGELDLTSPSLESRIVNVTSAECGPAILVVPGQPANSFLYDKISSATPTCGAQMPQTGSLTPSQIQCVSSWITALAPAGSTDAGMDAGG